MNRDSSWQEKLDNLGSPEERRMLQQLRREDPDLADAMFAKLVEDNLDSIGLETTPDTLHKHLYAITGQSSPAKKSTRKFAKLWPPGIAAAAVLMVAVMIKPWSTPDPSAEEVAQARQQLAVTFYYLNKAADITRRETEHSIVLGVKTAMDSSPYLDVEALPDEKDDDSI